MKFEVDIGEVRDEEIAKEFIKGFFKHAYLPLWGGYTLYFPSITKSKVERIPQDELEISRKNAQNLVNHYKCEQCLKEFAETLAFRASLNNFTAKVDSKGRIVIRSDVRAELDIKAGDRVKVMELVKV